MYFGATARVPCKAWTRVANEQCARGDAYNDNLIALCSDQINETLHRSTIKGMYSSPIGRSLKKFPDSTNRQTRPSREASSAVVPKKEI